MNCKQCKHFFITWDQQTPNGCKKYGFKTREIPSILVKKTSGEECLSFVKKQTSKNNRSQKDNH